jgi:hypothetical protein
MRRIQIAFSFAEGSISSPTEATAMVSEVFDSEVSGNETGGQISWLQPVEAGRFFQQRSHSTLFCAATPSKPLPAFHNGSFTNSRRCTEEPFSHAGFARGFCSLPGRLGYARNETHGPDHTQVHQLR